MRWRNCRYRGKAIIIKYFECMFVALGIQHAIWISRIILSSVAYPALLYFSTFFHKRHDFRGGGEWNLLNQNECFDFLFKLCLTHFPFQEEFIEILSQIPKCLLIHYPLFWSDFNETRIFFDTFFLKILKFHQNSSGERRIFSKQSAGQTDITKPIATFCNFGKATKIWAVLGPQMHTSQCGGE